MPETPPDPDYLDAFLQGARFALFAFEGRLAEDHGGPSAEVSQTLGEIHRMFSTTREGLEASEAEPASIHYYLGKN